MDIQNISYTVRNLQRKSYRCLQKLAKSLFLPSNVKKHYLIELIHAKKFKPAHEVECLVHEVKAARILQSQRKKSSHLRRLQNQEISSTCGQSPPITYTPKRMVNPVTRYSPEFTQKYIKLDSGLMMQSTQRPTTDRVLRSFNLKALRKSFGTVSTNKMVTRNIRVDNKATSPKDKTLRMNDGLYKFDMARRCLERQQPNVLCRNSHPAMRSGNPRHYIISHTEETPEPKRQRTLSGIYPLQPKENTYKNTQIQAIKWRNPDGTISTINALFRKPISEAIPLPAPKHNNDINIQEIFNDNDIQPRNPEYNSILYPNTYGELNTNRHIISESKENDIPDESEYYHKKIRSEQVRYQRMSYRDIEDNIQPQISCEDIEDNIYVLPRITAAFSQFNRAPYWNVSQSLYIQVGNESESVSSTTRCPPTGPNISDSCMLETIYNFKNSLLTNTPLLPLPSVATTYSVYTAPVIAKASATQTLTIPEMVEDALEIISQDGGDIEQTRTDIVRLQCVLCSWAGPKIILEYHIRKDHSSQIYEQSKSEWCIVYSLGALWPGRLWLSQVISHAAGLFVLSARCDGHCAVAATLSSLNTSTEVKYGSITIFNKVTGEPFTWEGAIKPFPPNLPYENNLSGLVIEVSKLDITSSSNLELPSHALVPMSLARGNLNDTHNIMFFVKIY